MEMISLDLLDISFFRILEFRERKKKKIRSKLKKYSLTRDFLEYEEKREEKNKSGKNRVSPLLHL